MTQNIISTNRSLLPPRNEPGKLIRQYGGISLYEEINKRNENGRTITTIYPGIYFMLYEKEGEQEIKMGTIFEPDCDTLEHLIEYFEEKIKNGHSIIEKQKRVLPTQVGKIDPVLLELLWRKVDRMEKGTQNYEKIVVELMDIKKETHSEEKCYCKT